MSNEVTIIAGEIHPSPKSSSNPWWAREFAKSVSKSELGSQMKDKVIRFEVLAEDEWEAKLNEILQGYVGVVPIWTDRGQ